MIVVYFNYNKCQIKVDSICWCAIVNASTTKRDKQMSKFTKNSNNQVTLTSNGSIEDGMKVADWARNLINRCAAEVEDDSQGYTLSAPHLSDDYAPEKVVLTFKDYYFMDISFWLKTCKL